MDLDTLFFATENIIERYPTERDTTSVKLTTNFEYRKEVYHVTIWRPPTHNNIKALVFMCHGFGEHLNYYDDIGRALAANGMIVFGHDHIGHGHTSGDKVQVKKNFHSDYVKPVLLHCHEMVKLHSKIPLMISGHSLGGLIALNAIIKEPTLFKCAVLVGPLLKPAPDMASPLKIFIGKQLSGLMPNYEVNGVPAEHITRNELMVRKIKQDRFFWHGGIKLKQGSSTFKALDFLKSNLNKLTIPIFIQQGGDDKICLASYAQAFYDNSLKDCPKKQIKIYEGAYHHLYIENDDIKNQVIEDQVEWLKDNFIKPPFNPFDKTPPLPKIEISPDNETNPDTETNLESETKPETETK